MAKNSALVTASFLTTEDDYAAFKLAACRAALKKKDVASARVCGLALLALGILGRVFLPGGIYRNFIYYLMIIVGFILCVYYDTLQPYLIKRRAAAYFAHNQEKMIAQTLLFFEDRLEVQTDRYTAKLPYSLLYQGYEDGKVFLLYTGIGEMRFLPKRSITQEDCQMIHEILTRNLQENYKQEGVR